MNVDTQASKLKRGDSFHLINRACKHTQKVYAKNQYGTFIECRVCNYKYNIDPFEVVAKAGEK